MGRERQFWSRNGNGNLVHGKSCKDLRKLSLSIRNPVIMASVTLTNRELKNKATGIDIRVPQHEHISGPLGGNVLYHVIVVTRLFYFKTPGKHKESDVVQFMIPQKYEVFEDLCAKLSQKFPSVVFSSPPKKTFLVSDSVISDRRRYMEDVLQQIARTPKLACSSLVLEFLGAKRGHKDVNRLEITQTKKDPKAEEEESSEQKPVKEEEVEDVDLFAKTDETDVAQNNGNEEDEEEDLFATAKGSSEAQMTGFSIFDNNDKEDLDDEDINKLFIPAGADENKISLEVEDNSQLLNIEDDLDKLLTTKSKPVKPAKPAKPEKPVAKPRLKPKPDLKPKPTPKPRFADAGAGEEELFGGGVPTAKPRKPKKPPVPKKKATGGDEDLFVHARKQSFNRTPSREDETLDDIFNLPAKSAFTTTEEDDDLFKSTTSVSEVAVQDMSADDIASYIQQNMPQSDAKLDLFGN